MGIRPLFSKGSIKRQIEQKKAVVESLIEMRLRRVGLDFVSKARINADFTDRTGNLRSSIGFIILKDGSPVYQNFETSKKGTDKQSGLRRGLEFASKEGEILMVGYVLIVVAGMEYAAAVESKGFDVLTSGSIIASRELKGSLDELTRKLAR